MQVADADYQIMIHLSFDEIIAYCKATQYTTTLCANKQFWLNKIDYDNLLTPDIVLFNNVGGMKCYYLCDLITNYLNIKTRNEKDIKKLVKNKKAVHKPLYKNIYIKNTLNAPKLISKYGNIIVIGSFEPDDIISVTYGYGNFMLTFKTDISADKILLNKEQFIDFLFEGMSTDTMFISH